MTKKEIFNYNLLTQTSDKISYIIIMNFVSIAFAIGIIMLWLYIDKIFTLFFGVFFQSYFISINDINIGVIACGIVILPIVLGANIVKVFKNTFCIFCFIMCLFLFGKILDFQWGWLLVIFGNLMMIVPNILLLCEKINFKLFLFHLFIVNCITFTYNFIFYGEMTK